MQHSTVFKSRRLLDSVAYVIEATPTERQYLWERYSGRVNWVADPIGWTHQLGVVDGRPVVVSINYATINGHRVAFYDGQSQLMDWAMAEAWWRPHHAGRHCDAANFHTCLHYLGAIPEEET